MDEHAVSGPGRVRRVVGAPGRAVLAALRQVRAALRVVARVLSAPFRLGTGVARAARRGGRAALDALRRAPAHDLPWFGAAVVGVLAFGTASTVYDTRATGWGVMPFVGLLVGAPVGLLLLRPFVGWAASAATAAVLAVLMPRMPDTPWPWLVVHGLALLALLLATCLRAPGRHAAVAWAATAALFAVGVPTTDRIGWVVAVSAVALFGLLLRWLAVTRSALDAQTRRTDEEQYRRRVLEERTRIARDLHDVVAHHMSLIVVQAETAPYRRPDLSAEAREELASLSTSARAALAETRTLLGVLRSDDQEAPRAPQPGLGQVADLCDAARRAGVTVTAQLDADPSGVRPGTELAAYRIVQEGLANAARHAPGAAVEVDLTRDGAALRVGVRNGPSGAEPAPSGRGGHGLVGMREHAASCGGTLTAGPAPDGGFAVTAVLPADPPAGRQEDR